MAGRGGGEVRSRPKEVKPLLLLYRWKPGVCPCVDELAANAGRTLEAPTWSDLAPVRRLRRRMLEDMAVYRIGEKAQLNPTIAATSDLHSLPCPLPCI